MTARDWLGLLIRVFGVYLCANALMAAADTLIDLVFGNHMFGLTFRTLLNTAVMAGVGLLLMMRTEDVLKLMKLPGSGSGSGTST
jgi:hypothetical protein